MSDDTPFFIVGAGRSGTTLLRLILAGHSRIHIPPETWFIRDLVRELPLAGELTPGQVDRAAQLITEEYRWPDMGMDAADLKGRARALSNPRLVDIIDIVYRYHLETAGKPRLGDKTPAYFDIVPHLTQLYPGARFIHLIRDGRDVAISWIDLGWEKYYQRPQFEWPQVMADRRRYQRTLPAGTILEVHFEDLVRDTDRTVRRICDFLGEDFEPRMMDHRSRQEMIPERERHIHRGLDRPISSDAIDVWKRKLSGPECFAMEACLQLGLRDTGYGLRFGGAVWRPVLVVTGALLVGLAPIISRLVSHLQDRGLLSKKIYF